MQTIQTTTMYKQYNKPYYLNHIEKHSKTIYYPLPIYKNHIHEPYTYHRDGPRFVLFLCLPPARRKQVHPDAVIQQETEGALLGYSALHIACNRPSVPSALAVALIRTAARGGFDQFTIPKGDFVFLFRMSRVMVYNGDGVCIMV